MDDADKSLFSIIVLLLLLFVMVTMVIVNKAQIRLIIEYLAQLLKT